MIFSIDLSLDYIRQPNTITNLVGLVIITSIGYATYFLTKIILKKNEKNN